MVHFPLIRPPALAAVRRVPITGAAQPLASMRGPMTINRRRSGAVARTEHFIGLEWLRFLLAIYVVLFHTVHAYVEDEPTWLSELAGVGFFATSSFFVLSGFLLAHVYCRQGELREPARHFLGKRTANLYPLHLFSLLLTAIVLTIIAKLGIPPDDAKASLRYVVYDTNEELSGEARAALEYFMNNRELAFNFILQLLMLHAQEPLYLTFNPPLCRSPRCSSSTCASRCWHRA